MFNWFQSAKFENFLEIDIHSHLLPGIDDGVQTIDESIDIIKFFESLGYKKLITTPHILSGYYPNTPDIISKKLHELKDAVDKRNIEIEIEAAAEYFLDEQFVKSLRNNEKLLTFGDNYILLETGFMNKPVFLNDVIFELQAQGYKPVLAHPERYVYFQEDYESVETLSSLGILFQLNALSLKGYYSSNAKRLAEHLMKDHMIKFIGSDVHNMKQMLVYKSLVKTRKFQQCRQLDLLNSAL